MAKATAVNGDKDKTQDKKMVKAGVGQHESKMHPGKAKTKLRLGSGKGKGGGGY